MECPVQKDLSCQNYKGVDIYRIIDASGCTIATGLIEKNVDYIVQTINSHEKYKIACAKAYEGLCTNDLDVCDEAIKLLDEITKEAGEPK